VPVEIAVAIGITAFLVGALSMGVLWFLYSRALRIKALRARGISRAGKDGAELQTMLDCNSSRSIANGSTVSTARDNVHDNHNGNVPCPTCPLVVEA